MSYSKPDCNYDRNIFEIVPLLGTSTSDEQSAASECDVIDQLQAQRTKNYILQAQIQQLKMKVKELEQAQQASNTLQHFQSFRKYTVYGEII